MSHFTILVSITSMAIGFALLVGAGVAYAQKRELKMLRSLKEAEISINGRVLSERQSEAIRYALISARHELRANTDIAMVVRKVQVDDLLRMIDQTEVTA